MLVATFTFSAMNVVVKMLPHIPAIEIILFRSLISLIISGIGLKMQKVSVWGNNKPLLLARGIVGAAGLYLFFTLLQQIPLATASTLNYLAPIFTTILGIFILKEKIKPIQWLFFLLSFSGVLIVRGFDSRISITHLLLALSASAMMGLAYNIIRKLKFSEHPLVIIFYFPLVTLPIAGFISWFYWITPVGWDWFYLLLVGILTQVAQFFMTKAYQAEEVNKVAIVNYTGLVYALGFGFFIFGETFNLWTYIGMFVVVAGVVLNVTHTQLRHGGKSVKVPRRNREI